MAVLRFITTEPSERRVGPGEELKTEWIKTLAELQRIRLQFWSPDFSRGDADSMDNIAVLENDGKIRLVLWGQRAFITRGQTGKREGQVTKILGRR